MGASDPPGTTYIPGLRENLHGLFTVNLGVYVPEVARHHGSGEAKSWVQDYHCCVRSRLADACGERKDLWWQARVDDAVVDDIRHRLELGGFPSSSVSQRAIGFSRSGMIAPGTWEQEAHLESC